MDANKLLGFFSDYTDLQLAAVRRTPVVDRFPSDPSVYVSMVNDFFHDTNSDLMLRFRLERILIEFLYHDGRTFEALLTVADWASQTTEFAPDGINGLGGYHITWIGADHCQFRSRRYWQVRPAGRERYAPP